jgi:hypothetical protein
VLGRRERNTLFAATVRRVSCRNTRSLIRSLCLDLASQRPPAESSPCSLPTVYRRHMIHFGYSFHHLVPPALSPVLPCVSLLIMGQLRCDRRERMRARTSTA